MIQASESRRWWWFVLLAIAAVVPRLPAVLEGFGIEDLAYVQYAAENSGLAAVLLVAWPYGFYRPLVTLYFELLQPLFGDWAPGYHLASLAVHLLVAWLVFRLVLRVAKNQRTAYLAALVFAVMPSHTEAIAWACSIGDLLAAALVIVSVLLAIAAPDGRPGRAPWFWIGALLAALAACGAKESAVAVGLAAPLAAWLFAERRAHWAWLAGFPSMVLGYVLWYGTRTGNAGAALGLLGWPHEWLKRFFQDIGMVIIPVARGSIGDRIWSDATLTWMWTAAGSVLAVWLIFSAWRKGGRVMFFGWFWAAVFFFPSWRLTWSERYSYLPSVGLVLVAAVLINRASAKHRRSLTVCVLLTAILLAVASGVASASWGWD